MPILKLIVGYEYGQVVYLKTDEEQKPRIVTGLMIRDDAYTYELSQGVNTSWHHECELVAEKDFKIQFGIE